MQGKDATAARKVFDDARALADAGCFSVLMEAVPAPLAAEITKSLAVPTIGIGAGNQCDGQVLVMHDLLGLYDRFVPKFVKQYAKLGETATAAIQDYVRDVANRSFPVPEHSFHMKDPADALLEAVTVDAADEASKHDMGGSIVPWFVNRGAAGWLFL